MVARLRSMEVRGQVATAKIAPPEAVINSPQKKSAPTKNYAQEYRQPFTDRLENIPGWRLMTPNTGSEVLSGQGGRAL